jgi:hypothetical protein
VFKFTPMVTPRDNDTERRRDSNVDDELGLEAGVLEDRCANRSNYRQVAVGCKQN